MKVGTHSTVPPSPPDAPGTGGFESRVLRLVKGARERRAIESGQVDAILDPARGRAILLPDAQAALLERNNRFRNLVQLASDGYWEQDAQYRFVSHVGSSGSKLPAAGLDLLGKTFWDLALDNYSEVDWKTLRTQLQWRIGFRDLYLRYFDAAGDLRTLSVSGEPMYDGQDQFGGYCGVTRDITRRRHAEAPSPDSDGFARATLDALAAQVCVLDMAGVVLMANRACSATAADRGLAGGIEEGRNYLAACDRTIGAERVDASELAAGIRQVMAGQRERFSHEYLRDAPSGAPQAYVTRVIRFRGDGPARAILTCEDITGLRLAEQGLRLELDVARGLAAATQASEALQSVIREVCTARRWDSGRYFRLDRATGDLKAGQGWAIPESGIEPLTDPLRGLMLRPAARLAERVCQSGEPLWLLPRSDATSTVEAAVAGMREADAQGHLAIPVTAERQTMGVLVFSSRVLQEPDAPLLHALCAIGALFGESLLRRQSEDQVRRSEARFRRLTELSTDWCWEQDRNFRFTKIVGPAMARSEQLLGRTLWELPNIALSAEQWTKHRSELSAEWSFCDFEFPVALDDGRVGYYSISGEPVYDEAGIFTGFHGTGLDITQRKRAENGGSGNPA